MAVNNLVNITIKAIDGVKQPLEQMKGSFEGFGKRVKGIEEDFKGMNVASGIAFAGLSVYIKSAVDSANESIRVNTQLEAVLKSTSGAAGLTKEKIQGMSEEMQKQLGISDEVIGAGQNMLLTFTNIGKDVFPEATRTLVDMATAMNNGAVPSAEQLSNQAIQLGKALNDPSEGLKALSRVGVTFTSEQETLITQMVETGNVAEAQKVILAELGKEFGGSALAQSQTFEGQMRKIKVTLGDVGEKIGTDLVPSIKLLLDGITPVITKVTDWIARNPKLTSNIILATTAILGFGTILAPLITIIGNIIKLVKWLGVVLGFLSANPIGILVIAIGALIAVIALWIIHWKELSQTIQIIGKNIQNSFINIINDAKQWGANMIQMLIDGIKTKLTALKDGIISISTTISDFLGFHSPTKKGPGSDADKWMPNLIKMLVSGLENGKGDIGKAVDSIAQKLLKMKTVGKTIEETFGLDEITNKYISLKNEIEELTKSKKKLSDEDKIRIAGLKQELAQVKEVMTQEKIANADKYNAMSETQKLILSTSLASKNAFDLEGVQRFKDKIDALKEKFSEMKSNIASAFDSFNDKIEKSADKIKSLKDEITSLKDKFSDLGKKWSDTEESGKLGLANRALELQKEIEDMKKNDPTVLMSGTSPELRAKEAELAQAQNAAGADAMQTATTESGKTETQKMIDDLSIKLQTIQDERTAVQKQLAEKKQNLIDEKIAYEALKTAKIDYENQYFAIFKEHIETIKIDIRSAISLMTKLNSMSSKGGTTTGTIITGAKAEGGSVFGGNTYLVGENGPELFTPLGGGYITPNNKMSGGSIGVNINLGNVQIFNAQDENKLIGRIKDELIRTIQLQKMGISI